MLIEKMPNPKKMGVCPIHGNVEYRFDNHSWKCVKCASEAVQRRRDKVKELGVLYLGGECLICGYKKCIGALEFHHLDPNEKDFGISAKGYTRSWETVKSELKKCVVLCSNCHREVHCGVTSLDNVTPKYDEESLAKVLEKDSKPKEKEVKTSNKPISKCPSKEILEDLVSKFSNCAIGRQYSVSDTTVRKWRKKYNI